jgi:aspartyl-tRNA synthetase
MKTKKRVFIEDLRMHVEKEVFVQCFVSIRRDHGKLLFFSLRDMTGSVQGVVLSQEEDLQKEAQKVKNEFVLSISGIVRKRPEKMIKKEEENGDIELEIQKIDIESISETLPFDIHTDTRQIDEQVRLHHRYLDLRSKRLQENIRTRSSFIQHCRTYLFSHKYTEIETPLLTESTPEGCRDFVVPSRLHKGHFYALPQSPQQYKQLLMTSGFERYFQIARALRDEDLRSDRGFEHTQIDIEVSFVEREDILSLVEGMMIHTVEKMGYTIKEKPFPRITYKDALEKYGADKFDLRTEEEKKSGILAYAWVIDFPQFEKTEEGKWTFTHNPFSLPLPEYIDDLMQGKNIENILSSQYDLVCNGFEAGGGSIRAHKKEILEATYKVMGYTKEEIQKSIGHMLTAFSYGTPPHGGIALGVERNIMNLRGEAQLKEVQAFPMTRGGRTSVMNGPSPLNSEQLLEFGLRVKKINGKEEK